MKKLGDKARIFVLSGHNNPEMATVYRNDFMPAKSIKEIEAISDPRTKEADNLRTIRRLQQTPVYL